MSPATTANSQEKIATDRPVLVTGANGFIGANVARTLATAGQSVVVCDVYDDQPRQTPDVATACTIPENTRYNRDCQTIVAYVDREALTDWLETHGQTLSGIVHLGACSDTTVRDRDLVMRLNYDYSRMIFEHATRLTIPLVYASSAATYGDGSAGFDDEQDPARYQPINLYGESKHHFDLWALEQQHTPPRWAGLKYFNVFGPREQHKQRMASMAYHWYNQIQDTGEARLFESHRDDYAHGEQQRDFIYVQDAVAATLHLLNTPASETAPNGLYNVGTGQARTFKDLAHAVFAAMNLPPKLVFIPMPEDLRAQYQYFTQATTDKLRRAGFTQSFTSLEAGVSDYVQYRRQCADAEASHG